MEIKEIIESAIRGGWSNYDSVTDIACSTVRFDEGNSSTDLFKILLEKDFWGGLAETELGLDKKFHRDEYVETQKTEWAKARMYRMIDHITSGGTAESYIKSL